MSHLTSSGSRDDLRESDVATNLPRTGIQWMQSLDLVQNTFSGLEQSIVGEGEIIHTSPDYDSRLNYDLDLDEVNPIR